MAVVTAVALCLAAGACGSRLGGGSGAEARPSVSLEPLPDTAASVPAGDCAGLANGTGLTADQLTIANASDVSGPVPGLFETARAGTKAFVEYFNATQKFCGRSLKLLTLDSRTDSGGDQQAAAQACQEAFALVGSMSAFDQGGAKTVADCGIPDLRAAAVNPARSASKVTFGANSLRTDLISTAVPDHFRSTHPDAAGHAAYLYINAGSAKLNAQSQIAAWQKRGFHWSYTQPVDVFEVNYSPYVLRMKREGVKYVQFLGPYKAAVNLASAMQQQGFKPDLFVLDPTAYNPDFVSLGGPAVEGTRVFINTALFEESAGNPELTLYLRWLKKVAPDATPTYDGLFAWSAARLFTEQAIRLGGKLTRTALLAALAGVHGWTGHGLTAPQDVGGRRTGACNAVLKLSDGHWVRESKGRYLCGDLVQTGVGK
jgi:ABC-type branched-subunit amino acid transport system substrate-binding protein